ncbi:hypothetical protein DFH06DRAFT_1419152 [Mycena polygramma]|nr:hypothetical protein DFH06DRAFT_1419152 [Mycena polygramma]
MPAAHPPAYARRSPSRAAAAHIPTGYLRVTVSWGTRKQGWRCRGTHPTPHLVPLPLFSPCPLSLSLSISLSFGLAVPPPPPSPAQFTRTARLRRSRIRKMRQSRDPPTMREHELRGVPTRVLHLASRTERDLRPAALSTRSVVLVVRWLSSSDPARSSRPVFAARDSSATLRTGLGVGVLVPRRCAHRPRRAALSPARRTHPACRVPAHSRRGGVVRASRDLVATYLPRSPLYPSD